MGSLLGGGLENAGGGREAGGLSVSNFNFRMFRAHSSEPLPGPELPQ